MDIMGIGQLLRQWSQATRVPGAEESGGISASSSSYQDRETFIRYADDTTARPNHPNFHTRADPPSARLTASIIAAMVTDPQITLLITFSANALEELRRDMLDSLQSISSPSFPVLQLSLNDCDSALLWCSIVAAHQYPASPDASVALGIPVDIRTRMSPALPTGMCNAIAMAWPRSTLTTLLAGAQDLAIAAQVACKIRAAVHRRRVHSRHASSDARASP